MNEEMLKAVVIYLNLGKLYFLCFYGNYLITLQYYLFDEK